MNNEAYFKILDLERSGGSKEALKLLLQLAEENHPMALLDLSIRYLSVEGFAYPVEHIEPDAEKSEKLALKAKGLIETASNNGDGEAMRMLASFYMGHWHPIYEKSNLMAEQLLLKSIEAGCYFAANELATFYLSKDIEKAKYYYQMASNHDCRVIYHEELET